MKSKMVLTVLIVLGSASALFAQNTYKEEVDAAQAIFGKDKKELVGALIQMNPEESAKFWPIYDQYETERKALGQQRLQLIQDLSDAYANMTADKADAVSAKSMKLSEQNDKLLSKYYGKVKKATSSTIAFEWYQAEVYILTEIRVHLMSEIPLYSVVKPK